MKQRTNTPKYGIIYNCSFIGRAQKKDKGRISRYVASKSSVCSRIDAFMDARTDVFGKLLKQQCEDRLKFYEGGCKQTKNIAVMNEAMKSLEDQLPEEVEEDVEMKETKKKKKKKRKMEQEAEPEDTKSKKKKKKKKTEDSEWWCCKESEQMVTEGMMWRFM